MELTAAQAERAAGVLVAQACGDALGVPYEFAARLRDDQHPAMVGGGLGPYEPGEYSDDTQMAMCIALVAAERGELTSDAALDDVAEWFEKWFAHGASDVGNQTREVLSAARRGRGAPAERLRAASYAYAERHPGSAGNGALMRTAAVALPHLGDDDAIAGATRAIAELTHADPRAGDSAVLWSVAIDRAVREARFDVRAGLPLIPADRRDQWAAWIDEAEARDPRGFNPNGFTVHALQAAWSAIVHTPDPADDAAVGSFPCLNLQHALDTAVRIGHDTDTVAAIAGALLGARWGMSAVPFRWRRVVHGWPKHRARDLARMGALAARRGASDAQGWPTCDVLDYNESPREVVPHPYDKGVLLGTAVSTGADKADAVVSLCRLGRTEVPRVGAAPSDHLEVWLIDAHDPAKNPNLAFVIDDAARAVAALRGEGRTVLLHCVRAESRTPAVARYATLRGAEVDDAIKQVTHAVGASGPNPTLMAAVRALAG
jgi:ADP-ribosyl-[dinitrogen reductase] hydrolase